MNQRKKYLWLWLLIFFLAAALRIPELSLRPMHGDEAVQALKFAGLLEAGHYQYDPGDYHGPTLYYLTLPLAWSAGYTSLAQLNASIMRLVSVLWGLGTLFIFVLLANQVGRRALIAAGLYYALSTLVVYYNRYYIHESLFSFFIWAALAFGYLYIKEKKRYFAVLCGISLGLLIATKETWVVCAGAAIIALVLLPEWRREITANIIDIVLLIITPALLLAGLFYTSFFTNLQGIPDLIRSFGNYLHRGIADPVHNHPWYYYLKTLVYFKGSQGPFWSEAFILVLAIPGSILLFKKKYPPGTKVFENNFAGGDPALFRLICVFTLLLIFIFSFIPYKIPWNMLGWMPGLVLLGGWTIDYLILHVTSRYLKYLLYFVFCLGFLHQLWQCWQLNYRYECSPANPYVYAHTGQDIGYVEKAMSELAVVSGYDLRVDVIFSGHDYWPLPWYLRSFKYTGWWDNPDPQNPPAPVILISADQEDNLLKILYELTPAGSRELYLPLFDRDLELRPGTVMRGYINYTTWQKLKSYRQDSVIHH